MLRPLRQTVSLVDVRVVVAMREGYFREDLYYRLNVFAIQVPPLCERDILFLARHFLADYARDLRKPLMRFSREAEELLQQQVFPGNVRMLKNAVERAAILFSKGESTLHIMLCEFVLLRRMQLAVLSPAQFGDVPCARRHRDRSGSED